MRLFKYHTNSPAYAAFKLNGGLLGYLRAKTIWVTAIFLMMAALSMSIARTSIAVERDEISSVEQAISDLLLEKILDKRISLELSFNSKSKLSSIDSKFNEIKDIVLEKFDPKYSGFRAKVIYLDKSTDSISGKYFSFIEVPVAAKYIRYNEIVQQSDLSTVSIRLDRLKRGIITDATDIAGKKAKKQIAPGNMFNGSDLSTPPVININDPVNIVFSSGAINLKTTGIALGSGIIGESIKVKNESSGTVLLGEIINKNTVRVGGQ